MFSCQHVCVCGGDQRTSDRPSYLGGIMWHRADFLGLLSDCNRSEETQCLGWVLLGTLSTGTRIVLIQEGGSLDVARVENHLAFSSCL